MTKSKTETDTVCRHSLNDGTMRTTVARSASGKYLVCAHGTRGLCFRYLWFGEPVGALQETMEGAEELARRRTIIRRFGLLFFNRRVDVTPTRAQRHCPRGRWLTQHTDTGALTNTDHLHIPPLQVTTCSWQRTFLATMHVV